MRFVALAAAVGALLCFAGHPAAQQPALQETVTVVGENAPVTLGQAARSVEVMSPGAEVGLINDPVDALRTDSSVDVQMRGPMGVQSDLSIRGGTFEQTLVLLNGFRIDDAETAHFNLDPPIPFVALDGMEVLHGAGSTLYGSDALSGTVELTTEQPQVTALHLRTGLGSFGIQQDDVVASLVRDRVTAQLSGERDTSSGFIPDRDYRSESAGLETRFHSWPGASDVLVAGSDRSFGASDFYGEYPSFERTKGWFASATQDLGAHTAAAFAFRRHSDVFVLLRGQPAVYENNHVDTSTQAILRRHDALGAHVSLFMGIENDTDQIQSNSLGQHGRNRGAGYADADFRLGRTSLSAGLREEFIAGHGLIQVPGLNGAVRLGESWKVRGSLGYGFRLPTYVDLYYSDPTTAPNPALKPESAWTYDAGVDWFPSPRVMVAATGFTSRQNDAIDYVRSSSDERYQAQNLSHVQLTGAELSVRGVLTQRQSLQLSYTGISGAHTALGELQSRYLANYPSNNASAEWLANIGQVATRLRVGATQRYDTSTYATLDIAATRGSGSIRPSLQVTNVTNTGYEEIAGVRMQGRAFIGSVALILEHHRR